MRILIAGDTHGSLPWTLHLLDKAVEFECDAMFVLGDFGFWPRHGDGRDFLYKLEHQLKKHEMDLWWLDGNHEDHDELDKLVEKYREMGAIPYSNHIAYTPRGYGWNWGGLNFVALGGATSIDVDLRTPGKTWFPQEGITDDDVTRAISRGRADILLAHDIPVGTTLPIRPPVRFSNESRTRLKEIEDLSRGNRIKVQEVAEQLGVSRIYHGHHHISYRSDIKIGEKWVKLEGLACHGMNGSWTILDTESM